MASFSCTTMPSMHGKVYVNGHVFVSLTMNLLIFRETAGMQQIRYVAVPLGYSMSNGETTKLTLGANFWMGPSVP